jgi:hypothetical protein
MQFTTGQWWPWKITKSHDNRIIPSGGVDWGKQRPKYNRAAVDFLFH